MPTPSNSISVLKHPGFAGFGKGMRHACHTPACAPWAVVAEVRYNARSNEYVQRGQVVR
jgi:hypothetical protein